MIPVHDIFLLFVQNIDGWTFNEIFRSISEFRKKNSLRVPESKGLSQYQFPSYDLKLSFLNLI